jgi:hypothetical protein
MIYLIKLLATQPITVSSGRREAETRNKVGRGRKRSQTDLRYCHFGVPDETDEKDNTVLHS